MAPPEREGELLAWAEMNIPCRRTKKRGHHASEHWYVMTGEDTSLTLTADGRKFMSKA